MRDNRGQVDVAEQCAEGGAEAAALDLNGLERSLGFEARVFERSPVDPHPHLRLLRQPVFEVEERGVFREPDAAFGQWFLEPT